MQHGGRRRTDEAIENDHDAPCARFQDSTADRGLLAPTERGECRQWITDRCTVGFHRAVDDTCLQRNAFGIRTSARPGPVRPVTAKDRTGQRGCDGRIADPHFAENEKLRLRIDGFCPLAQGIECFRLVHGGSLADIACRPIELQGDYPQVATIGQAELVDRRAAILEIANHLRGNFLRERIDPLCADAVIAGKDQRLGTIEDRLFARLPAGQEHRQIFQHPERARRLGKFQLTLPRGFHGRSVGATKIGEAEFQFGETSCRQAGSHGVLSSRSWEEMYLVADLPAA